MDLIARLRAFAFHRPHVLVLETAGGTACRLGTEAYLRARGWPQIEHPADADVLVVCGWLTPELSAAVGNVQAALAQPALSLHIHGGPAEPPATGIEFDRVVSRSGLKEALSEVPDLLLALDAEARCGHAAHRRDDANHGDDAGHSNDGDTGPAGLPMAELTADRDGLMLDALHVPLGPFLAGWPVGLRVTAQLQGDVVQQADVDLTAYRQCVSWDSWWERPWRASLAGERVPVALAERWRAASHLDSLQRLLTTAGHAAAALGAARARDAVLGDEADEAIRRRVAALARRIRRGGLLERMTRASGTLPEKHCRRLGVTGPALRATGAAVDLRGAAPEYAGFEPVVASDAGDSCARWHQWLLEIDQSLTLAARTQGHLSAVNGRLEGPRGWIGREQPPPSLALLAAIKALIVGQELAGARLTIASLDPDANECAAAPAGTEAAGA